MLRARHLKEKRLRVNQERMIAQVLDENCELRGRISHLEVTIKLLREKKQEDESILCEVAW